DRGGGAALRGDAAARPAPRLRPRLRRDAAPPPRAARGARPLAARGRRPRARTARGPAGRDADARPAPDPAMTPSAPDAGHPRFAPGWTSYTSRHAHLRPATHGF